MMKDFDSLKQDILSLMQPHEHCAEGIAAVNSTTSYHHLAAVIRRFAPSLAVERSAWFFHPLVGELFEQYGSHLALHGVRYNANASDGIVFLNDGKKGYVISGTATVYASGHSNFVMYDTAKAFLKGNAQVMMFDNTSATAYDNSVCKLFSRAHASCADNTTILTYGCSTVDAGGNSKVYIVSGALRINAVANATVYGTKETKRAVRLSHNAQFISRD